MANNLNVTELDFDQIKDNLKNFLKSQSEYNDYDFDGSGLSVLLDVLAYNTHYNAVNAHYSLNEAFLDSAQIRGNVVTRAKLLGYTPRSVLSPRATVNIVIDITGEDSNTQANNTSLVLPRGTKLKTNVGGESYDFVVLNNYTVDNVGNKFTFNNVEIVEGTYKTILYRVDNDIENQKFQLGEQDGDTSTLRVRVQQNEDSLGYDVYNRFESLLNVDSVTQVYYLQENPSEYFEVFFGDGVIGRKPVNNNIVTLDYIFTNGSDANGASVFSLNDTVGGFAVNSVSTVSEASGGTEKETAESIRFNAPLTFTTQNRAVTAQDYRAIILKNFSNISSISTWGGEDNDPVDFGRVYVSVKPLTADVLTDSEKSDIKNNILKGKNIVSITPELVDPESTNLELDVFFKYNPNLTDRSSVELSSVVRDTVSDYNFNNLNKFDGVFRHSQLTRNIDNSDPAILNTTVRPRMFQNITPANNALNNFSLSFSSPFFQSGNSSAFLISSSAFKINNVDHFFGDEPITDSTKRNVIVYKVVNEVNTTVIKSAGEIDVDKGTILLNNFTPDTTDNIKITVLPNSLDLGPKRDQLISIDNSFVVITPEIDTIAVAGSAGSIDYTTTSRFK